MYISNIRWYLNLDELIPLGSLNIKPILSSLLKMEEELVSKWGCNLRSHFYLRLQVSFNMGSLSFQWHWCCSSISCRRYIRSCWRYFTQLSDCGKIKYPPHMELKHFNSLHLSYCKTNFKRFICASWISYNCGDKIMIWK